MASKRLSERAPRSDWPFYAIVHPTAAVRQFQPGLPRISFYKYNPPSIGLLRAWPDFAHLAMDLPRLCTSGRCSYSLLGLLTLVISATGIVWWSTQEAQLPFNESWADVISEIYALALLGFGLIMLLIRRPSGWGNGLAMLVVLFIGILQTCSSPLKIAITRAPYAWRK